MISQSALFAFELDDCTFAIRLDLVERTYRAVEITPLPGAPAPVLGIIDIHGTILPVMNVRMRFFLQDRELRPSDCMIVAWAGRRQVVLAVDRVVGIVEVPPRAEVATECIVHGVDGIEGVLRLERGLIFIHDLAAFLSLHEEETLAYILGE